MQTSFVAVEQQLLNIVKSFLIEVGNDHATTTISLDAALDRELGIGSLEKTELLHRIESSFKLKLSDNILSEANTLRDLIVAIHQANPAIAISANRFSEQLSASHVNPKSCHDLIELLKLYAEQDPNRPHIYLQDETANEQIITYGKLYETALIVAGSFQSLGLKPSETVAIMLPTSTEFFYTFFGVLLAGGIPVPIYPPFRSDQIEEYTKKEAKILRNAEVRFLITFHKAEILSKILKTFIPSLISVTSFQALLQAKNRINPVTIEMDDPAMIQYTSGSTGDPKGVLLTHANLLANIRAAGEAINVKANDVMVSWLPLYHDMGLIGAWFGSLYHGVPLTVMSPLTFLARPERWLWAIHSHRGTISAGPNFAYELCVKKIADKDIEGLDLSSWRLAFNGAEPIHPKTLQNFIKRFAPYGFKAETMFPVYGLAECSVALSFPKVGEKPYIDRIQRKPFETLRKAVPASEGARDHLEFVGCGNAIPGHAMRIVDEQGNTLGERHVGQLQFQGPSAMQSYYRNPQATSAILQDGWWDTGDYAYMADNRLFVTGRRKDTIIKAGRNLYPAEIENLVTNVKGIRKGCTIAFGVMDAQRGTEKLIITAETRDKDTHEQQRIIKEINQILADTIGLPPDQIILVEPGKIPKTSSGKLRRAECKNLYLSGKLSKSRSPIWMQLAKISFSGIKNKLKMWGTSLLQIIYGIYVLIITAITLLPILLTAYFLKPNILAKSLHYWAKLFFILLGCPITVQGKNFLSDNSPKVIVVNHTSYLDVLLLLAILPSDIIFVAKQEFENVHFMRALIDKLGHIYVDRFDASKSETDTQQIAQALKKGRSVVIFPEGTFSYASGLRPFRLGAFKIASELNKPILPVAIQGLRQMLRSGSKLPKPSHIKITLCEPIIPGQNNWEEANRLRQIARQEIAKYCGEPTLNLLTTMPAVE